MIDWSRFAFDYVMDLPDMLSSLVSIEARKEASMSLLLPPDWNDQLDRRNRIRSVHGSTALEGNPMSEEQVAALLADTAMAHPDARVRQQVRNADTAQRWVRSRFKPGSPPLRVQEIYEMHRLLTRHSDESLNTPGRLRCHGVQVGTPELSGVHIGAPHPELPRLMDEFVGFVTTGGPRREHPVVRALIAHFFLVTIHPFGDGNGRVSRLVEAAILYQGGYNVHGFYGLSNYFYRNADEYRRILQECRRSLPLDLAPFVRFGLRGFESELRGINSFLKTKLNRLVYRETMRQALSVRVSPRRRLLNPREYHLLSYLLEATDPVDPFSPNPSVQIGMDELIGSPYVREAYRDVTDRTFMREIGRLVRRGFIALGSDPESGDPTVTIDFSVIEKDLEAVAFRT